MTAPIDDGGRAQEMTLRDYFAAQAFPGLLSGATWGDVRDGADECAKAAYALADAMLQARKQVQP